MGRVAQAARVEWRDDSPPAAGVRSRRIVDAERDHSGRCVSSLATEHEHRRRDAEDVRRRVQRCETIAAQMSERNARVAVAAIFFLYVLYIRVYDVADTFLMLGEQTRDWSVALGGLTDLPLTGAPSTAGGRGFGPIYYWILWVGRHLVGPFFDYLPHAGGVTVALLQSGADTWLLSALWRRVGPLLALAMCLTIASAPFDIAISSVIWNPPVAAALIKMATAMALQLGERPPRWRIAITVMLAWFAVQAHLSAIFVAAPLLLALVATDLQARRSPEIDKPSTFALRATADEKVLSPQDRLKIAAMTAALVAVVGLTLKITYFISVARDPAAPMGPTNAINTIINTDDIRIDRSYSSIVKGTGEVLVRQFESWRFQIPTLIAALVVLVRWRRDLILLAVSIGGIAGATVLFATWTRGYDSYWFLTLTTAMVLTFGMAIAAIPYRPALLWIGLVLLAGIIVLQRSRVDQSTAFFKYPAYRTMRIASYELAARHPLLRDIRMNFDGVHPTMDKYIMYRILGGRIDPSAPQQAYVNGDGSVRIE